MSTASSAVASADLDTTSPPCSSPGAFVEVPGQGPSCWTGRAWLLRLSDGHEILTHGPDAIPATDLGSIVMPPPVDPPCVPEAEPHNMLLYVRAIDTPDAYATMAPEIRTMAAKANAFLRLDSGEFDMTIEYRFLCDGDGATHVENVVLTEPSGGATFYSIANELRLMGYTSDHAKYWVWYDRNIADPNLLYGGQGEIYDDDRPTADNLNNGGGSIAINYEQRGDFGAAVMMHENGHNLGAVQLSSPQSSGGWHCNDGLDIMCYEDGGETAHYESGVCDAFHFDCNHDDYFHPHPAPGSYLANHWNVGSAVNRFLRFQDGGVLPPPPRCDWDLKGGNALWFGAFVTTYTDYEVPPPCPGEAFLLNATTSTADMDICWMAGGENIACHQSVGPESGTIPFTAEVAHVMTRQGVDAEWELKAGDALDGPPPPGTVDLSVDAVTTDPAEPIAGSATTFRAHVVNSGPSMAGAFDVDFTLDGVQSIGTRSVGSLDSGEGAWLTSDPWTAAEGDHSIAVTADSGAAVTETDETNNGRSSDFAVAAPPPPGTPDLAIIELWWSPTAPTNGAATRFFARVGNLGSSDASAVGGRFILDGTQPLGEPVVATIPAGGEAVVASDLWAAEVGDHSVRATADPDDAIAESDESNNVREAVVTVAAAPQDSCYWHFRGGNAIWVGVFLQSAQDFPVPEDCPGAPFILRATTGTADVDVCWLQNGEALGCHATEAAESGTIPTNATTAHVLVRSGVDAEFEVIAGDAVAGTPPPPSSPPSGTCSWDLRGGGVFWYGEAGSFMEYDVAPACRGHRFFFEETTAGDFDLCWLEGGRTLSCFGNLGMDSGWIPSGATIAKISARSGVHPEFHLQAGEAAP